MLNPQSGIQVDKFYPPTDWQYSFPDGYTRLEYLESTGTQYIDTGLGLNLNDTIIMDAYISNVTSNGTYYLFEAGKDTNNNRKGLSLYKSSSQFRLYKNYGYSSTSTGLTFIEYTDKKIIIETKLDNGFFKILVNNNIIQSIDEITNIISTNLTLFGGINGSYKSSYKLYNFIVKDYLTGNITYQFVPTKRNSDNKPGMYDLVNNVFYVNQGSGADFTMGPELYQNKTQIDIRQKNNLNFGKNYEFNSNNELTWANPNLYLTGKVNYTKVGSPTIVDNIVSGFSSSNYLRSSKELPNDITNLQINIRVKRNNLTSGYQSIMFFNGSKRLSIEFKDSNAVRYYYNGSNTNTNTGISIYSIPFVADTWYDLRIDFNSNTHILNVTIYNGDTIIKNFQQNNVNIPTGKLQLGYYWQLLNGSIDLSQTYIKVNNELWFYGKVNTTENIAPVPAGFAYNNTTTPSVGIVDMRTQTFTPAPEGAVWKNQRDISVVAPEDNTITLLYGVKSDFSAYSLFGLLVNTSSGNYNVYIDDVLYATTTKNTQTDIDFSTLGSEYVPIGTTTTTPEELKLHKIVIKPTMSGQSITLFRCARTSGVSTTQSQGILWIHYELSNKISLESLCNSGNSVYNNIIFAITAKNDTIFTNAIYQALRGNKPNLKYIPLFKSDAGLSIYNFGGQSGISQLKRLRFKTEQNITGSTDYSLNNLKNLEQLIFNNELRMLANTTTAWYKLKLAPKIYKLTSTNPSITEASSLYPTKLDFSDTIDMSRCKINGTSSYPSRGLKVSNEAPFSGTSPQIDVSYTGLDRNALVELFNSLPDVSEATDGVTRTLSCVAATGNNITKVGSPTIDENGVASGFDNSNYLTTYDGFNISNTRNCEIVIYAKPASTKNCLISAANGNTNCWKILFHASQLWFVPAAQSEASNLKISASFDTNTFYYIKATKKDNIATISYSIDGVNWQGLKSDIMNWGTTTTKIYIGYISNYASYFGGSVDLKNTYIKVDNNYLMKGYLLPSDIAIATNKGWTVTAS